MIHHWRFQPLNCLRSCETKDPFYWRRSLDKSAKYGVLPVGCSNFAWHSFVGAPLSSWQLHNGVCAPTPRLRLYQCIEFSKSYAGRSTLASLSRHTVSIRCLRLRLCQSCSHWLDNPRTSWVRRKFSLVTFPHTWMMKFEAHSWAR